MKNTSNLMAQIAILGAIGQLASLPEIGSGTGKRGRSRTMYIAASNAQISGNNGLVLKPSTLNEVGVTNFEKGNTLPKGQSMLVTGVRVLADTTASATVHNANWGENAPVEFLNGEVEISQSGQGVLFQASGSDCTNFKASTGNDDCFREVVPFLLRSESPFDIKIALNGNPTATPAVYKVELRVVELIDDSRA